MDDTVKMTGITMQFPAVLANDNVNLEVRRGEVLALVGENGAGKSTLMNILYGLYQPTLGKIEIWGREVKFHSAIDAIRAGIGMVHQHFMLIPRLSVADNIVLGTEPRRGVHYDRAKAMREVETLCREYDMKLDSGAAVSQISLGMQQRVEIVKALYRGADVLILDEPTAVLTPQEIDELGVMLKKLTAQGKTIIIITHKLKEVLDFSDRVTVLRRGKVVGTVDTAHSSAEEITQMMVGRSVHLGGNKEGAPGQEEILRVEGVRYHDGRVDKLKEISLAVRAGEILGVAGIDNSGQRELTEVIAGLITPGAGHVYLDGQEITGKKVPDIKAMGVGFIPQDRQRHGLVLDMTIAENMVLGYQRQGGYQKKGCLLDKKQVGEYSEARIRDYDIRPDRKETITRTLSGGNQQKVVVAREVSHATRLIIADQPSRGVDIGAIELIHKTLVEARNRGEAVLLVSLELDEVMLLSDRIAVLYDGKLMGILDAASATREQIGLMMAGQEGTHCNEKRQIQV